MDYSRFVPRHIRLYIFDLDGTLVDSLEDLFISVNEILCRKGFPGVDRETVRRSIGNGARILLSRCFEAAAVSADRSRPDDAFIDGILPEYRACYEAHSTEHTELYPGMREWIESLCDRGCLPAVLSNKPQGASERILAALGVGRFFSVIAGPEFSGVHKPDPAGVLMIMDRLGCGPEETVFVGDSEVDVATARNAGILACAISGGIGDADALRASGPDIFIERKD